MKLSIVCVMRVMLLLFLLVVLNHSIADQGNNQPGQIHLALAGKNEAGIANSMTISWVTATNTTTSTVRYGFAANSLEKSAEGPEQIQYYESFHHHVTLPELKPNSEYFYSVGDKDGGFSKPESFRTGPARSDPDDTWSFAVFADLGVYYGESSTNYVGELAQSDKVEMVLHGGDIGYADDAFTHPGCYARFCYESTLDDFMSKASSAWAQKVPYMVAPGNHEADCHSPACLSSKGRREKLSNFTAFNSRFRMPSRESGSTSLNMHYSFNYRNVHFISLDSETGYPGASEEKRYVLPCGGFTQNMLEWLEADLIQANRERTDRPWIFVQAHRPLYQGASINKEYQAAVEELFHKYRVDIYFSGHVHSYERSWPVYQGKVQSTDAATAYKNPKDTTYLMIGGAGNDEMKGTPDDSPEGLRIRLRRQRDPAPDDKHGANYHGPSTWRESDAAGPWTAKTDDTHFGIGRISILDATTLQFDYIQTTEGTVFDSFTLEREH